MQRMLRTNTVICRDPNRARSMRVPMSILYSTAPHGCLSALRRAYRFVGRLAVWNENAERTNGRSGSQPAAAATAADAAPLRVRVPDPGGHRGGAAHGLRGG